MKLARESACPCLVLLDDLRGMIILHSANLSSLENGL